MMAGGGRSYTRRCTRCGRLQHIPLPSLAPKVIYVDQFVISNVVKALDPTTEPERRARLDPFWKTVFEKLHRLCKLHLIICPDSPLHYDESVVIGEIGFKKLKRIYELLSGGPTFYEPERVRNTQIVIRARKWIARETHNWSFDAQDITNGSINDWRGHLQLTLNTGIIPGLVEELREASRKKADGFSSVHAMWQNDKNLSFWDWFREERLGLGKVLMEEVTKTLARQIQIRTQHLVPTIEDILPNSNWGLFVALQKVFGEAGLPYEEAIPKVWEFLTAEELGEVPYVRISCLMFAAMAQLASRGKKTRAKHPFNDVDMVSAYLPYCDAIFVDKEIESVLAEKPLPSELGYPARVFSVRSKDLFLNYLDQIESEASPEHLSLVREVYGKNWEKPYVEVFAGSTNRFP
jgi:hypothetical protein